MRLPRTILATYEKSAGVAVDLYSRRAWWLKSAEQGYVKAEYNMGWFLSQRAEGYTEGCDKIAATLTAEQYEQVAASLIRLRP